MGHVVTALDKKTSGPGTFDGPIGKMLPLNVSDMVKFDQIPNAYFPILTIK